MTEVDFDIRFLDVTCRQCGLLVKVVQRGGTLVMQVPRDRLAKLCERAEGATRTCTEIVRAVAEATKAPAD